MNLGISRSDAYILMIFYVIAIPITISFYDYNKGLFVPIADTLVYTIFSFIAAYVIVYKFFPLYFPEKKIIKLFLVVVPFMAICGIGELFCYQWISDSPMSKLCTSNIIFWSISETAENAGILIGILLAKKYYDAQVHLEKRKKEKKENELRLLRSQIDPHFLFNNLNTLDALIDKDPNLAKSYLNELSHLYRYLIRTKDDDVVLLKDELAFAKNYIFLIEKRFGNLFKFQIEGIENLKEQYIPPGALQVVIENVVKHNKGIVGKPLTTFLRIDKESVSISNEIRKKFETEESLGTGLKNLKARYSHLTEKKIKIEKSFNFKITLPTLAII